MQTQKVAEAAELVAKYLREHCEECRAKRVHHDPRRCNNCKISGAKEANLAAYRAATDV